LHQISCSTPGALGKNKFWEGQVPNIFYASLLDYTFGSALLVLPQQATSGLVGGPGFGAFFSSLLEDYDGSSLKIRRAAWRKHVNQPKGKRGTGTVPLIPTAASVLDEHLASVKSKAYMFETFRGDPADLDYLVREVIRPKLADAGLPWYGLHAFRRGLPTS
jgi:hypothetical protein